MAEVVTFGCRLNSYESEVMRRHAEEAGLGEVVIINSCAVTAEAARQTGQAIRRARREHPNAKIIVTGCAAQITPEKFAVMPEVDAVIGNDVKLQKETFVKLAQTSTPLNLVGDIMQPHATPTPPVEGFEGMARAFVEVQNGCDHRCTYCIIPYGRGASRSIPFEQIETQVQSLVSRGYNEIVISGVDIASYGLDMSNKTRLGTMLAKLLKALPDLQRLRLSSLDPAAFDEDLWTLIANEPRVMPHLHLSLQSGDNMILKRMKRRHSREDVIALVNKARALRPDVVFGADIIAGFPTETDEMFENTLALVEECDITWLHVFTYSARTGTPAAKMPQVHGSLRRDRAALLRAVGDKAVDRQMARLQGRVFKALVEQKGIGCAPDFTKLMIPDHFKVGDVVNVRCTGRAGDKALASGVDE